MQMLNDKKSQPYIFLKNTDLYGKVTTVQTRQILQEVWPSKNPEAMIRNQQDAPEYLQDAINQHNFFQEMLEVRQMTETWCLACNQVSKANTLTQSTILYVPTTQDFADLECQTQMVPTYKCEACNQQGAVQKQIVVSSSEHLIVLFKRYSCSSQGLTLKVNTPFKLPDQLELCKKRYTLRSYVSHHSTNQDNGHYTITSKLGETWVHQDDDKPPQSVTPCQELELRQQSYYCLYTQINSQSAKSNEGRSQQAESYSCSNCGSCSKVIALCESCKEKSLAKSLDDDQGSDSTQLKGQSTQAHKNEHIFNEQNNGLVNLNTILQRREGKYKSKVKLGNQVEADQLRKLESKQIYQFIKSSCFKSRVTLQDFDQIFDKKLAETVQNPTPLFHLVDQPFIDGLAIPKCQFLFQTIPLMKEFLDLYINVYSIKTSQSSKDCYFLRIDDESSLLTIDLARRLSKMMKELRKKVRSYFEDRKEEDKVDAEVQKVYLHQIDITQDFRGLFYCQNIQEVKHEIAQQLGYQIATNYRCLKPCVQLALYRRSQSKRNWRGEMRERLKIYCKAPLHLLQTDSLNKKISMGLKALLMSSNRFYRKLRQCQDSCMSRMERCFYFLGFDEEQTFLNNRLVESETKAWFKNSIIKINSNKSLLQKVSQSITMDQLWRLFWDNVKSTVLIRTSNKLCLLYGSNSDTSKYYGVLENIPYGEVMLSVAKRYALPFKVCQVFELHEVNQFTYYQLIKQSPWVQLPIAPLCTFHKSKHSFPVLDSPNLQMRFSINPNEVQLIKLGNIESNLQEEKQQEINAQNVSRIHTRYSKHAAKIITDITLFTDYHEFHLVTFSKKKLTLYDDINRFKYQQAFDKMLYQQLEHSLKRRFKMRESGRAIVSLNGISLKAIQSSVEKLLKSKCINRFRTRNVQNKLAKNDSLGPIDTFNQKQSKVSLMESPFEEPAIEDFNQSSFKITDEGSRLETTFQPFNRIMFEGIPFYFRLKKKGKSGDYFACIAKDCKGGVLVRKNKRVTMKTPHSKSQF